MLDALGASGPAPEHAEKLMLFGQFVGAWELDVVGYRADGTRAESAKGEWHFGWVLEGRAVQDVWLVPPRPGTAPDGRLEYGTTVRFYDPEIDAWRIVWSGPLKRRQVLFTARRRGDEIVLEGAEGDELVHWIFSDIEPRSFKWRAEISIDGGESWRTVQEMAVRRSS
jgi:hypothetical protein